MSDSDTPRPFRLRRERRANATGGRTKAHLVKVTPEEESALLARAQQARVSVPRLMVEAALADHGETATDRRTQLEELFRAFRLLAALSNNVNQMAKATNATGEVAEELAVTLAQVRRCAIRIDGAIDAMEPLS
ncbi:plasmid mobilization protein [Rhodococcus rhodnii]|uniref:plasmid mobilization protein n=1 Tax=Rhodococcus rhodnii TaxID=38312 RepID=UPI0009320FD9|nr:plasmid mobilization relaxosome protein MobC [Rhodococcus rhodnii]